MENQDKPKRQLTEAQRLAFLKAREKRMVNLEKKRQEELSEIVTTSEEGEVQSSEDIPQTEETISTEQKDENVDASSAATKKPRKKYTKKTKSLPDESNEKSEDIETVEYQSTDVNTKNEKENNEHENLVPKDIVVDHDLLADRIVERIAKLDPPVLKRETATRQPKQRLTSSTPPQINFNWM